MTARKQDITAYFRSLDRGSFMDRHQQDAGRDEALPIGYGQTISQPSLVLEMTVALDLEDHHKVLEIGTGSGFQTALLAAFSREVYTVEKIPQLAESAKKRLEAKGFENISFLLGDGSLGWPEHAPYDRIIVTAAASDIPKELVDQLANGGRMLIPVGHQYSQDLLAIDKSSDGRLEKTALEAVRFVPLKGKYEN
ncbi:MULTISPECIES: protein-L-isoaspartate(D-aspartate) O-methyltransferase [Planococcus]|uniref:Protein-L-isoaspartate O-methyltransferase n=2 Tax=Planococcus TaxID=1372 RepID=A0A497YJ38_9BACL|nr:MULTISPECIES: protein-L-isoaspartate(D-aspartate) O-methyltransferase [Planococcus]RAZ69306.1 protein-L-isoaspartate(D-aspartate) O-methyltransferase [Planococcus maitriensis]RLJ91068.1 protein-L-isoaspartate(D-aspartate) O-methyltransferase [Planococcus citreus]